MAESADQVDGVIPDPFCPSVLGQDTDDFLTLNIDDTACLPIEECDKHSKEGWWGWKSKLVFNGQDKRSLMWTGVSMNFWLSSAHIDTVTSGVFEADPRSKIKSWWL